MSRLPPAPVVAEDRSGNRFDFMRLFAALLVLWSHSYPLTGRNPQEPLARLTGIESMGGMGVAIFFVLSGYLVTLSLERSPGLLSFARKRAVRIYPALAVLCALSIFVLGPVFTTLSLREYFTESGTWNHAKTLTAFSVRFTLPGVFETNPYPDTINGSLWTLPHELRCYVALALLSLLPGPLKHKLIVLWMGLFAVLLVAAAQQAGATAVLARDLNLNHVKFGLLFGMGAALAAWRQVVRPRIWTGAAIVAASLVLPAGVLQVTVFMLGGGLLALSLALGARRLPAIPERVGDLSYGAYIYGFPVQQILAHSGLHEVHFGAYVLSCTALTLLLAAGSWHWVEKPALRWK